VGRRGFPAVAANRAAASRASSKTEVVRDVPCPDGVLNDRRRIAPHAVILAAMRVMLNDWKPFRSARVRSG
jgi:hypothetical protein